MMVEEERHRGTKARSGNLRSLRAFVPLYLRAFLKASYLCRCHSHVHLAALELDAAGGQGEEGVVAADADVEAGLKLGAALAKDDRAGLDHLATVGLDAQILRIAVAAVPRRTAAF